MTGILPLVGLIVSICSLVKSQKRLSTLLFGLMAVVMTVAVCTVLGLGFKLDGYTTGQIAGSATCVIAPLIMLTHARSTFSKSAESATQTEKQPQ
jgi:hypothetical protein